MYFGYPAILKIIKKMLLTFVGCRVYINKAVANDNNKTEMKYSKGLRWKSGNESKKVKKVVDKQNSRWYYIEVVADDKKRQQMNIDN